MNAPYTSLIIGRLDLFFRIASLLLMLQHSYDLLQARLSPQPFVGEQAVFLSNFIEKRR